MNFKSLNCIGSTGNATNNNLFQQKLEAVIEQATGAADDAKETAAAAEETVETATEDAAAEVEKEVEEVTQAIEEVKLEAEEEVKEEVKAAEEVVQEVKEELPPPPAEPVVEGKFYCFLYYAMIMISFHGHMNAITQVMTHTCQFMTFCQQV